mmetsp:Transcript_16501/g.36452  ORF Transcript_16501/g.36452 Transcript_16501/m.36452 type:complete len:200 (+) Transcript_16501:138-737(+)|eukprot:CAMPEP_0204407492 /NCGR_PEP_ID=MMETSP0470-20130426/8791_1 /ASSEMBLY_ACC=CAM_ASM_000385 /TAXON_ID=2969 /ORGANISM="Oxyrrhis marina" /LENGTH=199 /DNA_ID=CAMNT_0051403151 /DNA_START=133 /DNA_END=732 /DNA_ORIENTATION=-
MALKHRPHIDAQQWGFKLLAQLFRESVSMRAPGSSTTIVVLGSTPPMWSGTGIVLPVTKDTHNLSSGDTCIRRVSRSQMVLNTAWKHVNRSLLCASRAGLKVSQSDQVGSSPQRCSAKMATTVQDRELKNPVKASFITCCLAKIFTKRMTSAASGNGPSSLRNAPIISSVKPLRVPSLAVTAPTEMSSSSCGNRRDCGV